MLLFLTTLCLVVAVQPCMGWIPIFLKITEQSIWEYTGLYAANVQWDWGWYWPGGLGIWLVSLFLFSTVVI